MKRIPIDSDEARFDRLIAKIKARPKVIDVTPTD
jgi:hypothetical protein